MNRRAWVWIPLNSTINFETRHDADNFDVCENGYELMSCNASGSIARVEISRNAVRVCDVYGWESNNAEELLDYIEDMALKYYAMKYSGNKYKKVEKFVVDAVSTYKISSKNELNLFLHSLGHADIEYYGNSGAKWACWAHDAIMFEDFMTSAVNNWFDRKYKLLKKVWSRK